MPLPLIPLIMAGVSVGSKLLAANKQKKLANRIQINDPTYQVNPLARASLAEAQLRANGRMAGAAQQEDNIYGNQATALETVEKYAPDSATALAAAGGVQGRTNAAFSDLALQEATDDSARQNEVFDARQQLIGEGDKVFSDQLRKHGEATAAKNALESASMQNSANAFSDLGNFGLMAASGMFGNTGSTRTTSGGTVGGAVGRTPSFGMYPGPGSVRRPLMGMSPASIIRR